MRAWLVRALGGYTDFEEALDSITDLEDKNRVLSKAVKRLFNTVEKNDLLTEKQGKVFFKGKELTQEQFKAICDQASVIKGMLLWKILLADAKYHANKMMYLKSTDLMGVVSGKLVTWLIDIFDTRLDELAKKNVKASE